MPLGPKPGKVRASLDPQVRRPAEVITLSERGARYGQRIFRRGGFSPSTGMNPLLAYDYALRDGARGTNYD